MPKFNEPSNDARGGQVRAFEGISEYRDESTAASLHEAIQAAARQAASTLKPKPGDDTEIFEVTRIQVEVGNPNVKVYRVEITTSDPA